MLFYFLYAIINFVLLITDTYFFKEGNAKMSHYELTSHEHELLQGKKTLQLLRLLACNPNVVFATQQQFRAEQSAHRVVDFVYISDDNYAIFCN